MTAELSKEEKQLQKRLIELAQKAYVQNVYTFSPFLSLAEQELFYRIRPEISHVEFSLWGGSEGCERQMLRFGSEEMFGYETPFPIRCIRIGPRLEKFSDAFTHRDFLGALMNMGIERDVTGDILAEEKGAYLFCTEAIAPFILDNLDRVKHTPVRCEEVSGLPERTVKEPEPVTFLAASERADGILAHLFKLSRSGSLELFRTQKVFVNGRLFENNGGLLKAGDVVSVRGFGKFIYHGAEGETRKGNLRLKAGVYR